MSRIEFSDELKEKVLNEYRNNNKTYGEIAEKFGTKREVVRAIICREVHRLNKIYKMN